MKKYLFTSAILALGLSAPALAAPVQWSTADGGNDHWYEVIWPDLGKIKWTTANSLASSSTHLGQTGYLATITSAGEQTFLNDLNAAYATASPFHNSTYVRAWLGGTDSATEGSWEWTTGESFAYENWTGNANNNGDRRDYLAGWWNGDKWKDCKNNRHNCDIYKYVVEYDSAPMSPVPIPASLPMIFAGLGMVAFLGRRRKKS